MYLKSDQACVLDTRVVAELHGKSTLPFFKDRDLQPSLAGTAAKGPEKTTPDVAEGPGWIQITLSRVGWHLTSEPQTKCFYLKPWCLFQSEGEGKVC